jgi:molybdopterin-binding protein
MCWLRRTPNPSAQGPFRFQARNAASVRRRQWTTALFSHPERDAHCRVRHHARTVMRISARNQVKGTVIEVKRARRHLTSASIGNGQIMTSSITNEAVDELGIKARSAVTVVVKASDVMIAVD